MKALSLKQPWASLMFVANGKEFETRSWRTKHRGLLAIHASKSYPPIDRALRTRAPYRTALRHEGELPLGAIIGILDIVDIFTTYTAIDAGLIHRPDERRYGDYGMNRFAWQTANAFKLPFPIPCNGALSLWDVPEYVEDQIKEQLPHLVKVHRGGEMKVAQ
jgi:activating signal cointegrator 1